MFTVHGYNVVLVFYIGRSSSNWQYIYISFGKYDS